MCVQFSCGENFPNFFSFSLQQTHFFLTFSQTFRTTSKLAKLGCVYVCFSRAKESVGLVVNFRQTRGSPQQHIKMTVEQSQQL
jgi:hypothetical protein